ncbi:MAG TPA: hypothetical protein PKW35_18365 [Nannocystaceae bacterium]|nr:hypothetical protein [Nannocystaceae bacterium]
MGASSEEAVVRLDVSGVLDFVHGSERILLYSSLMGEPPLSYVVRQLRAECPELQVGSVVAFSLATAPAQLRDYLVPQLRRLDLSDLWLPSGYYLFVDGSLVAHHHARPPEALSDYSSALFVAGFALAERLFTRRWGRAAKAIFPTLEVTFGQRSVDAFRPLLQAANARRSRRGPSERTTHGDARQGRGAEEAGAGARGGAGRASGGEGRGGAADSERLWSGDPYAVLGPVPPRSRGRRVSLPLPARDRVGRSTPVLWCR